MRPGWRLALPTFSALGFVVYTWSAVYVGPMVLGEGECRPSQLTKKIRLGADTTVLAELLMARRPVGDELGPSISHRLAAAARREKEGAHGMA